MKSTKQIFGIALALTCGLAATLNAQNLYVVSLGGTVGEYTLNGSTVNASLVVGLNTPQGVAVSGNDLFVVNTGNGTVGEYTTSGATVNVSLISGLNTPEGIAISGTNLFVANWGSGTIGEYTTAGQPVNTSLITGLTNPDNIAISGTDLFVVNYGISGAGHIGEYTMSGATVNASLITGLNEPQGIAISGTNLFVALVAGNILEYTTSGASILGFSTPVYAGDIAVSGTNLFVANYVNGTVGEYSTSGTTINASLISGLSSPYAITIGPPPLPPLLIAPVGSQSVVFYPYLISGTNFVLQSVTNVISSNWQTVTNGIPIIGVLVTNNLPANFFRLVPPP